MIAVNTLHIVSLGCMVKTEKSMAVVDVQSCLKDPKVNQYQKNIEKMTMIQQTFGGKTTDEAFERPDTQIHCRDCDQWILRSQRFDHDGHLLVDTSEIDTEPDDEPRIVGGIYNVYVDYTVTYRRQVAAADSQQARELAKESISPSDTPSDHMHMHDSVNKKEDLDENDPRMDDVPGWPW